MSTKQRNEASRCQGTIARALKRRQECAQTEALMVRAFGLRRRVLAFLRYRRATPVAREDAVAHAFERLLEALRDGAIDDDRRDRLHTGDDLFWLLVSHAQHHLRPHRIDRDTIFAEIL
jgi:hypothetical protein